LFKLQDAEEQFVSRLTLTGEKKKRNNPTEYAEGRSDFVKDERVPFNSDVRKCIQRKEGGTLKLKAAVEEPTAEELEAYLAWRDGQRVPAVVEETNIAVASVACVADNADVDENHVNSNDTNDFYFAFFSDISAKFKTAAKLDSDSAVAYLGSSTTVDLLTLMHNRTGHGNLRMLIEASKSKLVNGLKIEDQHIRKFVKSDKHVCDICARAKITRMSFNKIHAIRGNRLGDYISCDIAVFKNCPSREGYLYAVQFLDHATKYAWVYPMKTRDEFIEKLRDLIDVKLKSHGVKIKHYHADGGAELISKLVLTLLKREGARYTWNPAETPELNSNSERRFRTLGERTLSMLLRSSLPKDFWWDAYESSNYITNRMPTKTAKGYQTPYEGVFKEIPDLSNLRVWGCKTYLKIPKNYLRKDWREKATSGYLMGYSTEGEVGYKIYVPELQDTVVGVNCLFNEVIPTYAEEYFHELNKMQFDLVKIPSAVEDFDHLVGVKYIDNELELEFVTTRVTTHKGLIVGFRAPVLRDGKLGVEEKSPIHIADIVKMCGMSSLSTQGGPNSEEKIRGILKQRVPTAGDALGPMRSREEKGGFPKGGKVRFDLQELDQEGHDEPRRNKAGVHDISLANSKSSDSTMRSAHDTKLLDKNRKQKNDVMQDTERDPNRSAVAAHEGVQEAALRHKSELGLYPSRIVTRYDALSPEAKVDSAIDQMNPQIPDQHSANVSTGIDTFVNHKWDNIPVPAKRLKIPRNVTNITKLGNVYAVPGEQALREDELQEAASGSDKDEVAPETYNQAVKDSKWRESMKNEIRALKNRGCWRVVPTPTGIRLIKSKYVYKLKKDWKGKVVKRKSRLVVQGFLQREGVDFNETYAPVAKAVTFRLMLALTKSMNLHLHQLDVDSAFPYADLEEDVYMTPPPGMDISEGYCLKLLKSLYGLKQAPRNWNKNIVEQIKSLGFKQCVLDNCLFVKYINQEIYLISLYVDDILVAGSNLKEVERIKRQFTERYEMKDLGELNFYLGMKITRTDKFIKLDQSGYIREILEKYDYLLRGYEGRTYNTPMERELKLRKLERLSMSAKQKAYVAEFPYQNIVGALLYLALNTRPDISYAVGVLARFNTYPNYRACKALVRLLIYLRTTPSVGIQFKNDDLNLFAYSDADWAGDLDTRRSTTGYVVYAAGGPIAWQSKLQSTIAVSTMEAEYMSAFAAIQELIWLKGVLKEIGILIDDPITLNMDAKSAIALAKNPMHHKRSKHIDIKYHWLREHTYEDGTIHLEHCVTEDMVADLMTKALAGDLHTKHAKNATGFGDV
jgi:hypothetical protein